MLRQHFNCPRILPDAVGLGRIDLDHIASGAKTAEAKQVLYVLRRIEILTRCERLVVDFCELGKQCEIERVARFFEPIAA